MIRLFLLYAILIFAKRAPKLITDLLNIKSENVGLKGLSIKNKMGEAALVGDKVKKGMMAAEGGIKKAAGASHQILKNALVNPNGVAGKIGGDIKNGWNNGWSNAKNNGKGFFGKLGGAISNTAKEGKTTIWDDRKDNWGNFKGDVKAKLVDNAGDNAKKIVGNLSQGLDEYRKKDNTKGAYTSGRKNVDINFSTIGEGFEKFAGDSTRAISKWAGLDDDKAAKNRYDRSVLGMNTVGEEGGKKIKIDEDFAKVFPSVVKANSDGTFSLDAKGLEDFKDKEEYKSWNREKQLTFDKYTNNQARDDLTTLKACFDQMSQLTSAISSAKNANATAGLKPGQSGYIATDALEEQLKVLNNRVRDIGEQGYTYNKKDVDIANIDSAINKINEDISKNSSELSELKASQKPKEDKK